MDDCSFDDSSANNIKFSKKYNNNSFNHKDLKGISILSIFIISIALFIYNLIVNKTLKLTKILIISMILFLIVVVVILYMPEILLYAPSSIISLFTRNPEFLDLDNYFPNHILFENADTFTLLKQEVNNMLAKTNQGNNLTLVQKTYGGQNENIGREIINKNNKTYGWRLLNIKIGTKYTEDAINHFPTLISILEKLPEVQSCNISILEPGVTIPIHVGYYKGVLRYMLPIHIPKDNENVFLCVNGLKYHWAEGKGVLWDDTYPHKVFNKTNDIRIVIYMDVIRPLSGFADYINKFMISAMTNSAIAKKEIARTEIQVKLKETFSSPPLFHEW